MGLNCALTGASGGGCTVAGDSTMTCTACPSGCQAEIDKGYETCGGCADFDTENAELKALVETWGCAGAAHATPALFVAIAAVANHFLN